jgi:long-chain acyl-CoA synthetase
MVRGDMLATATWQNGGIRSREEEWLATGDMVAHDTSSGELRFLGRRSDVIVTSAGLNVHPVDLEEAMMKHAGVRGCVVVPCKVADGAEPVAVVLFSGTEQEMRFAVSEANTELAEYQKIRRALKWDEPQFPYTSTGKLLRRKVEQWACTTIARQQGGDSSKQTEGDVLLEIISAVTGEHLSTGPDQLLLSEDLHLDSLGRVQLQSALEQRFALELDDDAIAAARTLGDLRALLEKDTSWEPPRQSDNETAPNSRLAPSSSNAAEAASRSKIKETPPEHRYPSWTWTWPVRIVRMIFIEAIMRPLVWSLAAPRVVRLTSELPAGPLLVIANHVTAYDGPLILYALPGRLRRVMAIAMSGEMLLDFRKGRNQLSALRNWLAPAAYLLVTALFNVFPLPRLRGFRRSFAHVGEAMDRGYSVMIFPEGARSRDRKLQPFRPGIGLLASESGVPVLPVALIGLDEMRTGKGRWFSSGRLEIRIGEAITVGEEKEPAELAAMLEEALRRLKSEE